MSDKINDGGAAFPYGIRIKVRDNYTGESRDDEADFDPGMSLRDWFAGQALAGAEASDAHPDADLDGGTDFQIRAAYCYLMADAMLKARAQ